MGVNMGLDLQEEREYLEGLTEHLRLEADRQLEKMNYTSEDYQTSIRYFWENQSEFDEYETIFNQILVDRIVDKGEQSKEQLRRIVKMLDSPYFARVDFLMAGDPEALKVYIGKFPFWDGRGDYRVFDWRAPVSSMYYEFEDGPAFYEAPAGRMEGEITCKRQYRISRGQLEYAIESSISIDDELLQRELAKSSDHRMRDIVTTIQKEQNRLIRNETAKVLIIQGVAGSGKTSIALHRAAYFLYRYRQEITVKNFLIISPNGIFVDYISGVLPELGEDAIRCVGMEEIAASLLGKEQRFEHLADQTELFLNGPGKAWFERSAFKSTPEFLRLLEEYLEYCNEHNFRAADYRFEGGYVEESFIRKCYELRKKLPVMQRLRETADAVREEICAQNRARAQGAYKNEILEWLEGRLTCNDAMGLYQKFYWHIGRPELFVYGEGGILESADVFPFLYVKLYLEGRETEEDIRYLIIDEMQDHTPIQYAVLNRLYPCRKTILGDFAQNVSPFLGSSLDFLNQLYPESQVMEIRKSYRSTCEIMEFARAVGGIDIEPVQRHGERPERIACESREQVREKVLELARESFLGSNNSKLGIICKSNTRASELYRWLAERLITERSTGSQETDRAEKQQAIRAKKEKERAGNRRNLQVQKEQAQEERLHLLDIDTQEFYDGVMVTSVATSKGLEFDRVIIVDADDETYHTEHDRGLLYVACTRAMHSLTLCYSSKPSRFLPA